MRGRDAAARAAEQRAVSALTRRSRQGALCPGRPSGGPGRPAGARRGGAARRARPAWAP